MKVNDEPLTDEDIAVRQQLMASIAGLILFVLALAICMVFDLSEKYSIFGLSIPMSYIGINSIKNRFTLIRIRGHIEYKVKGTRAVVYGVLYLILILIWTFLMVVKG